MIECTIRFNAPPASDDPAIVYTPEDGPPVMIMRFEVVPRIGELLRIDGAPFKVGLVEHTPGANGQRPTVSLLLYEAVDSWP